MTLPCSSVLDDIQCVKGEGFDCGGVLEQFDPGDVLQVLVWCVFLWACSCGSDEFGCVHSFVVALAPDIECGG